VGLWENTAAISRQWKPGKRFEPAMRPSEAAERMARWQAAVARARGWAVH